MILIDNTQILMSSIFAHEHDINRVDEDLVRHTVLNCYRMYRKKFFREYGELVICQDSSQSWRRDFFPMYKAKRRQDRKENQEKWNHFFSIMNNIRDEVRENFPYKNIAVNGCEADDIIAVLTKRFHQNEKILILSGDKDFSQLQIYPSVSQYSPLQKKFIEVDNPKHFLLEHILRGDSSDGVPNILSDDDCFMVEDKRQTPVTKKRIEEMQEFYAQHGVVQDKYKVNWNRNDMLINLLNIPTEYSDKIETEYDTSVATSRNKLLNYMIQKGLRNLISDIGDF